MPFGIEQACLAFHCWRRYVDIPSYLRIAALPLRNRLGEPYLPQGPSSLNSLHWQTKSKHLYESTLANVKYFLLYFVKERLLLLT